MFFKICAFRKNNCQKIQPAHSMVTKRVFILRGSYFCEKYIHSMKRLCLDDYTSHKNSCLASRKMKAIFSGSCFCSDYIFSLSAIKTQAGMLIITAWVKSAHFQ